MPDTSSCLVTRPKSFRKINFNKNSFLSIKITSLHASWVTSGPGNAPRKWGPGLGTWASSGGRVLCLQAGHVSGGPAGTSSPRRPVPHGPAGGRGLPGPRWRGASPWRTPRPWTPAGPARPGSLRGAGRQPSPAPSSRPCCCPDCPWSCTGLGRPGPTGPSAGRGCPGRRPVWIRCCSGPSPRSEAWRWSAGAPGAASSCNLYTRQLQETHEPESTEARPPRPRASLVDRGHTAPPQGPASESIPKPRPELVARVGLGCGPRDSARVIKAGCTKLRSHRDRNICVNGSS